MYCKQSSFLIVGTKLSGLESAKLLLEKGAIVYFYDDSPSQIALKNQEELSSLGAKKVNDIYEGVKVADILVLSPAVPIDSEVAVLFKENGKRIIGEIELASYFITAPIIAVTGTNGKTSVCSIVSHVFNENNIKNVLVGNIGVPITRKIKEIDEDTFVVTEISSFQLETTAKFCPHIACILNLTEDHLNRHYTMQNYAYVKSKLLFNLRESEYAVLNYDDDIVSEFAEKTRANVVWFSIKEKVDGAYLEGNELKYDDQTIILTNELNLSGDHNISDVLACICILKLSGLSNTEIHNALTTFKGVKHRIELVHEKNSVKFYNDSKATNVDATIKAIRSMSSPTVLIVGGYDKGLNYDELMQAVKNSPQIKKVVITGASSKAMFNSAIKCEVGEVSVINEFSLAVRVAYRLAETGWNVLLSPSTSSFDEFSSFEERGEKFVEIVTSL